MAMYPTPAAVCRQYLLVGEHVPHAVRCHDQHLVSVWAQRGEGDLRVAGAAHGGGSQVTKRPATETATAKAARVLMDLTEGSPARLPLLQCCPPGFQALRLSQFVGCLWSNMHTAHS